MLDRLLSQGLPGDFTSAAQGGEIGDGYVGGISNPTKVAVTLDAIDVDASSWHSVAATSDGKVWTWGQNLEGQLGDGRKLFRIWPQKVFVETTP